MPKALAVIQTLKETGIADNAQIPRVQEVEARGSVVKVSLSYLRRCLKRKQKTACIGRPQRKALPSGMLSTFHPQDKVPVQGFAIRDAECLSPAG